MERCKTVRAGFNRENLFYSVIIKPSKAGKARKGRKGKGKEKRKGSGRGKDDGGGHKNNSTNNNSNSNKNNNDSNVYSKSNEPEVQDPREMVAQLIRKEFSGQCGISKCFGLLSFCWFASSLVLSSFRYCL